jgi:hypothetical protein
MLKPPKKQCRCVFSIDWSVLKFLPKGQINKMRFNTARHILLNCFAYRVYIIMELIYNYLDLITSICKNDLQHN